MSIEEAVRAEVRAAVREELAPLRSLLERLAPPVSEYLTVVQAAAVAHCHEDTIRKRLSDGTLKRYSVGRSVRVRRCDLESLLAHGALDSDNRTDEEIVRQLTR